MFVTDGSGGARSLARHSHLRRVALSTERRRTPRGEVRAPWIRRSKVVTKKSRVAHIIHDDSATPSSVRRRASGGTYAHRRRLVVTSVAQLVVSLVGSSRRDDDIYVHVKRYTLARPSSRTYVRTYAHEHAPPTPFLTLESRVVIISSVARGGKS